MTGPTGLINFFVLEATDYVEQLDSLLQRAGPSGPEAEPFTRAARALRGSATMARRGGISALAASVERLGRALRERVLPWTPAMASALAAAVADLRELVRAARDYGAAEERRAHDRAAELLGIAPPSMRAAAPTPVVEAGSGTMFVVSGASDVAAALTAAAARPANHELHAEALRRLRGFRGVAALRDHVQLAEVLDVVERVARQADRQADAPATTAAAVLAAGARQIRRLAEDIRGGRAHDRQSPEAGALADALARHEAAPAAAQPDVIPVAALFHDDAGPHVVRQATAPSTTAADRFRLEGAAAAEHLRLMTARARDADPRQQPMLGSGPGAAVQAAAVSLVELARSYGYDELASALDRALEGLTPADPLALAAADAVSGLMVNQRRTVDALARRVGEFAAGRVLGSLVAVGYADTGARRPTPAASDAVAPRAATPALGVPVPVPTPMPVPEPAPQPGQPPVPAPEPEPEPEPIPTPVPVPLPAAAAEPAVRPTGRDLHALLASSIAGFERMQPSAGSEPAPQARVQVQAQAHPGEDEPVPVELLLYRGRSALGRALELRDEIRRRGGQPPPEQLEELFDLLDLAASA